MTADQHWFEGIADHLGSAYLRYSHTKGTVQEVDWLMAALALHPGDRLLDVGCGPGRHVHEFARRGVLAHGVDISATFIDLAERDAPPGATFARVDARRMSRGPEAAREYDAVVALCQGAFGMTLSDEDDDAVVAGMAATLRPGGVLALSAFNAYFAVRFHTTATFDADRGLTCERTEVRDPQGRPLEIDLWTGCYTPRELRLLLARHCVDVVSIASVEPGCYGDDPPSVESPEFLVVGRRAG
ncbi:MAG: class I SAM-dependent methyltransferase [Actinomycetota bacterium]|nr:class I SAM-dependent methyltransferase [Actinomycetota bacterium]